MRRRGQAILTRSQLNRLRASLASSVAAALLSWRAKRPNDQRRRAGTVTLDCNRDDVPALAGATGWASSSELVAVPGAWMPANHFVIPQVVNYEHLHIRMGHRIALSDREIAVRSLPGCPIGPIAGWRRKKIGEVLRGFEATVCFKDNCHGLESAILRPPLQTPRSNDFLPNRRCRWALMQRQLRVPTTDNHQHASK